MSPVSTLRPQIEAVIRRVSTQTEQPVLNSFLFRPGRRSSWLPQTFVSSFNAEGDEVEGVEDGTVPKVVWP